MCNCIDEIKEKLTKHFSENKPDNEGYISTQFDDSAIIFGDVVNNKQTSQLQTFSHVSIDYSVTAKSGRVSNKNRVYNFTHKFCPFCGQPYGQEKEGE